MWDAVLIFLAYVMTVKAVWHKLVFAEGFRSIYNLLFGVFYHTSKTEDTHSREWTPQTFCKMTVKVLFFFLQFHWKFLPLFSFFTLQVKLIFLNVLREATALKDCPFNTVCRALWKTEVICGLKCMLSYEEWAEMSAQIAFDLPQYAILPLSYMCPINIKCFTAWELQTASSEGKIFFQSAESFPSSSSFWFTGSLNVKIMMLMIMIMRMMIIIITSNKSVFLILSLICSLNHGFHLPGV